jgi:hypothetical protein
MRQTTAALVLLAALSGCYLPDRGPDYGDRGYQRPGGDRTAAGRPYDRPYGYERMSELNPGLGAPSARAQARQQGYPPDGRQGYTGTQVVDGGPGAGGPWGRPANDPNALADGRPAYLPRAQPVGRQGPPAGADRDVQPALAVADRGAAHAQGPELAAGPPARVLNGKQVPIGFDPAEGGNLELWWQFYNGPWEKCPAKVPPKPPCLVTVSDEGQYGFTFVKVGSEPPAPGEAPQMFVEVDVTKPEVKLLDVSADPDPTARKLLVRWQASDKHLADRPITLSWAGEAGGKWRPIITELDNSGCYTWKLPAGLPARVLIRVEAADQAGNVGTAETAAPVVLGSGVRPAAVTIAASEPTPAPAPTPEPVPAPVLAPAPRATISGLDLGRD